MDKFVLDEVVLRKEYFGCIVVALQTNTCHQFNHDAFTILNKLKKPVTLHALSQLLTESGFHIEIQQLDQYLQQMIKLRIVAIAPESRGALIYFADEVIMRKDCLRAPTSVSFHITQFCPKECRHCVTYSSPYVDRSNELSPLQWFTVIEKLRDFGCTSIVFTGGDCLAKEKIFDILHKADREKFLLGVLTDYDGINQRHIYHLKNLKHLVDLQMSLDGATENSHDWMRGRGAFDKALRRMSLYQKNNLVYTVSASIHRGNINELESIAHLAKQYGATHLYVSPVCPYGRAKHMKDYILTEPELCLLGQKYLKLIKQGVVNPGNPYWNQHLDKIGDINFNPFKYSIDAVSTGFFNLSVDWKGDCFLDTKMRSENKFSLGNVVKNDIKDIWFNPKLNAARKLSNPESVYVYQSDLLRSIG